MTEILKIQLPLATYGARSAPKALVYNRDRSLMMEIDATKQLTKWVREDPRWGGLKTYVNAELARDPIRMRIESYALAQEW